MAEEEIDAAIDEANALIVSLPTVAEVEAQKKADRRKHLRLV
jgi:BarA-like signal transduction histidine kinase